MFFYFTLLVLLWNFIRRTYVSWRMFLACINVVYISATRQIIFCSHVIISFPEKVYATAVEYRELLNVYFSNTQVYRSWFTLLNCVICLYPIIIVKILFLRPSRHYSEVLSLFLKVIIPIHWTVVTKFLTLFTPTSHYSKTTAFWNNDLLK